MPHRPNRLACGRVVPRQHSWWEEVLATRPTLVPCPNSHVHPPQSHAQTLTCTHHRSMPRLSRAPTTVPCPDSHVHPPQTHAQTLMCTHPKDSLASLDDTLGLQILAVVKFLWFSRSGSIRKIKFAKLLISHYTSHYTCVKLTSQFVKNLICEIFTKYIKSQNRKFSTSKISSPTVPCFFVMMQLRN